MKALLSSPLSSVMRLALTQDRWRPVSPGRPDGLEPPSIRAGHTGPVTSFHIRCAANWTGLEEGAPSC